MEVTLSTKAISDGVKKLWDSGMLKKSVVVPVKILIVAAAAVLVLTIALSLSRSVERSALPFVQGVVPLTAPQVLEVCPPAPKSSKKK